MIKEINKKDIDEMLAGTKVVDINVEGEIKKSFIAYAMAVNVSRAIPDVRDGLKPVHRRILFDMYNELSLTADKPYRKCALIVGDVLGKFHPHGDSSVYDALVRLGQDFSIRCTLVDGHGNFGSVDGDPPAAYRYTEARLSRIAGEMLRDIEKKTVDFYPNFDDTRDQPVVLPSRYPNLLVNGSDGIAVGMATSIPPHNLAEVINGTIALLDNPDMDIDELIEYIPAPDYPTGALIMGRAGIKKAYKTGKGNAIIRSRTEIEDMPGGKSRIIVTEIPYQVNKAKLIESIADLVKQKRIEGISDVHEQSSAVQAYADADKQPHDNARARGRSAEGTQSERDSGSVYKAPERRGNPPHQIRSGQGAGARTYTARTCESACQHRRSGGTSEEVARQGGRGGKPLRQVRAFRKAGERNSGYEVAKTDVPRSGKAAGGTC